MPERAANRARAMSSSVVTSRTSSRATCSEQMPITPTIGATPITATYTVPERGGGEVRANFWVSSNHAVLSSRRAYG